MAVCGAFEVAWHAAITGLQVSMTVVANHATDYVAVTRDSKCPPGVRVLVGIDISKRRLEALTTNQGAQRRRKVTLTDAKAESERPVAVLSAKGLAGHNPIRGDGHRSSRPGATTCCRFHGHEDKISTRDRDSEYATNGPAD